MPVRAQPGDHRLELIAVQLDLDPEAAQHLSVKSVGHPLMQAPDQQHAGIRPDPVVDEDPVLVLKSGGPRDAGMGQLPNPKKLVDRGVRDMVRISDARMSGTSYRACVLHVAPESFVGGPLALARDGDIIELDVPARKLSLQVSDEELDKRRADWQQPRPNSAAATARCTGNTSPRPIKAATSTSSKPAHPPPNPRSTEAVSAKAVLRHGTQALVRFRPTADSCAR